MTNRMTLEVLKWLLGPAMAVLALPAQAGGQLSVEEVRALLTDRTVHARHEKDRYNFRNYYAPDGSAKQLTDQGEKKSGTWRLDSDGTLCVQWEGAAEATCGPLIALGDGRYKRMRTNPKNIMGGLTHIVTFERFENGNPGGL